MTDTRDQVWAELDNSGDCDGIEDPWVVCKAYCDDEDGEEWVTEVLAYAITECVAQMILDALIQRGCVARKVESDDINQ